MIEQFLYNAVIAFALVILAYAPSIKGVYSFLLMILFALAYGLFLLCWGMLLQYFSRKRILLTVVCLIIGGGLLLSHISVANLILFVPLLGMMLHKARSMRSYNEALLMTKNRLLKEAEEEKSDE